MALQFNDTSNLQGLIQQCESQVFGSDYGAISGNTTLLKTFTRYLNNAYDDVVVKILNSDSRWQFDDSTYTDYPIGVTTLVAGQQDYVLDVEHIKITSVQVKDANGNWQVVTPIDETDIIKGEGTAPDEFFETDGLPRYYDKKGTSIFLYPAPSATETTLASGLKVRFQREPNYFTYTDTTRLPGIPSIFHRYLSVRASFDYAIDNSLDKAKSIQVVLEELKQDLQDWFNKRDTDDKPRLQARKFNFK